MSAFLGPIHHWLFKKIVLFEELEKNIITNLSLRYGEASMKEIKADVEKQFGAFLPEKPLEMLIDTNNIHGWLQNRIAIAETRHAAMIKRALDSFSDEALEIVEKAYVKQGQEIGTELANTKVVSTAPELYQELNNYLLEGMPCDHVNNIISSAEDVIQWQITHCLHKSYWSRVGMNIDIMYNLRFHWVKAFVEQTNNHYTYIVDRQGPDEASLHNIILK